MTCRHRMDTLRPMAGAERAEMQRVYGGQAPADGVLAFAEEARAFGGCPVA